MMDKMLEEMKLIQSRVEDLIRKNQWLQVALEERTMELYNLKQELQNIRKELK